ncbi:DUF2637 domain-containing protein [Kribbella catacumbae]|uniref:DUF2637 domain-containing protein n=1 Tax=Kribbella catacumbae TaxID=460086 RepID=UPI000378EB9C|nr:DUF2637 domain-containing protein [Kribbella catacumbae]
MQGATLKTVRVGVGLTAFGASVISVEHVYHFARRIGESTLSAVLLSLVLEFAIMAGAATVLGWNRATHGSPVSGWLFLTLGLGGSMAGNIAAAHTPEGQVAAVWPPLLTFVGALVLAGLDRRQVVPVKTARPKKTATPVQDEKSSRPAVSVPAEVPSSSPSPAPSPSPVPVAAETSRVVPGPTVPKEDEEATEDETVETPTVHLVVPEEDLAKARELNEAHKEQHGKRISRDALKAAGFGTRKATELARVLRAEEEVAA